MPTAHNDEAAANDAALKFSEQQTELKWLIIIMEKLFHSSRVKLPLVSMSASWRLVSTNVI